MAPTFEVHVLFRDGRSVEEQWIRPGEKPWEKDELWRVLDGKTRGFQMLRRGTPLLAPFHVLQAPNSLINFVPSSGVMAAQLQNSQEGPTIRIIERSWAQALVDMGLGSADLSAGRASSTVQHSSLPPAWGGSTLDALVKPLKELPRSRSSRNFQPANGRGTLSITKTAKGTRLELFVPERSAIRDAEDVLQNGKGQSGMVLIPQLRTALEESFRRAHTLSNLAVPGMLANPEWVASRVKGTFTDENLQDLVAFGKMPSRFSLLSWSDSNATWTLDVGSDGWRLTIVWVNAP